MPFLLGTTVLNVRSEARQGPGRLNIFYYSTRELNVGCLISEQARASYISTMAVTDRFSNGKSLFHPNFYLPLLFIYMTTMIVIVSLKTDKFFGTYTHIRKHTKQLLFSSHFHGKSLLHNDVLPYNKCCIRNQIVLQVFIESLTHDVVKVASSTGFLSSSMFLLT